MRLKSWRNGSKGPEAGRRPWGCGGSRARGSCWTGKPSKSASLVLGRTASGAAALPLPQQWRPSCVAESPSSMASSGLTNDDGHALLMSTSGRNCSTKMKKNVNPLELVRTTPTLEKGLGFTSYHSPGRSTDMGACRYGLAGAVPSLRTVYFSIYDGGE